MSEELKNFENNQETGAPTGWDALKDVPFGGDNAIENVEKARAMAEAANENMSVAAQANEVAKTEVDDFQKFSAENAAGRQETFATIKAERAAQEYDGVPKDALVENVDKAMEMAMAENASRTLAAEESRTASIIESNDPKARGELVNKLRQQGYNAGQIGQIFANPGAVRESADRHNAEADKRGEDAGYLYDANH